MVAPSSSVPPPDIVNMVDKVARFVASRKPELEKFIAKNSGMCKYSFLRAAHPYHAYYQQRLSEFRAQNGSAAKAAARRKQKPHPDDINAPVIEWILERSRKFSESSAICDTVFVSPITGELVTFSMMSQQMEDPRYKEQKEALFAKIRRTTLAQDDLISKCIIKVAFRCPESFGPSEEEAFNAVKKEIGITNPELLYDQPLDDADDDDDDDDDDLLLFEDEFLSQHPGPVCISVWVPYIERKLEITVDSLSESVSSLKEKIYGQVVEAPPAHRQKLKVSGNASGFFKDWQSLAYYRVAEGVMLSLSW